MDENINNQIPPAPVAVRKSGTAKFIIFLVVNLALLFFFAIFAKDRGSWESLRFLFALPIFILLGIVEIVVAVILLKENKKNILAGLLLIMGIIFATYFPAVKISQGIQHIIFYQEYTEEKLNDTLAQEKEIAAVNIILAQPRIVVDVEDNYLLLKSSIGRSCYSEMKDYYGVVYLPNVKDFDKFEKFATTSLLNQEITATLHEKEFRKNDSKLHNAGQGIVMIEKIAELKTKIDEAREKGIDMGNYSKHRITLDCNFVSDIPVNLYLNGTLVDNLY